MAPQFILASCRRSWKVGMVSFIRRTVIKIALSYQNCIPFHFSYHTDHRAGYHAECYNVVRNSMIFICSLILPRFSMATANHLLVNHSEEWWSLRPAQPQPKEPFHSSQFQHHLAAHCHCYLKRNAEEDSSSKDIDRRVGGHVAKNVGMLSLIKETLCNSMNFICSLILPRFSMATANHFWLCRDIR